MENSFDLGLSTIRILLKRGKRASGIFLKTQRNNKPFYSIITNEHVISSEMIDKKESIIIKYQNQRKEFELKLDKKERIIINFKQSLDIDLIIIEIIPKDKIDESFFLKPSNYSESFFPNLMGKKIQIMEYPGEKELSYSEGKIIGFCKNDNCIFYHNCITEPGSSGSPIVLTGENLILGIHKASNGYQRKGIFIKLIVDIIKNYQRNGDGIEYYENGDLKYDGNFVNDEYDGNGIFHHNNNLIYVGSFKNGKKNGFGFVVKNDEIILKGIFENGKLIESHNNNINHQNHLDIPNQSLNYNIDKNNIINNTNYENNLSTNNNYSNNVVYKTNNNFSSNNYYTINNITMNKHNENEFKNASEVDNILSNKMEKYNEKKNNNTFFKDFYKGYRGYDGFGKYMLHHTDENKSTKDDCLIF